MAQHGIAKGNHSPPAAECFGRLPGKTLPFPLGRTLLAYDEVPVAKLMFQSNRFYLGKEEETRGASGGTGFFPLHPPRTALLGLKHVPMGCSIQAVHTGTSKVPQAGGGGRKKGTLSEGNTTVLSKLVKV